ncbi:unnamed protein product [Amoebophrya sp. A120]|nr:unnamed protein product [Amoebophrya sp. A120]|eukprot:GSA120T00026195001.1
MPQKSTYNVVCRAWLQLRARLEAPTCQPPAQANWWGRGKIDRQEISGQKYFLQCEHLRSCNEL